MYAVGEHTVLRYDGSLWTVVQGVHPGEAFDIWGSGPDDVFVVGVRVDPDLGLPAVITHYDGTSWSYEFPATQWPLGVWGDGVGDVFVVAMGGMILKRIEVWR